MYTVNIELPRFPTSNSSKFAYLEAVLRNPHLGAPWLEAAATAISGKPLLPEEYAQVNRWALTTNLPQMELVSALYDTDGWTHFSCECASCSVMAHVLQKYGPTRNAAQNSTLILLSKYIEEAQKLKEQE